MDQVYIKRVLGGDVEAFGYFVRTYKDLGYTLAFSILKNEYIAEEVVQDAFIKAFNGLKSFKGKSKFKTWFYRIVVNEAFQRLKKVKKENSMFETTDTQVFVDHACSESTEAMNGPIHEAIDSLRPKEHLAINLFYLEAYSVSEIGSITGWSKANTKVILHRARKNLKAVLHSGKTKNS